MAQNHRGGGGRVVVPVGEPPAYHWTDAQDPEQVMGDPGPFQDLRTLLSGDGAADPGDGSETGEDSGILSPTLDIRVGGRGLCESWGGLEHDHQAVGLGEGKGPKHDAEEEGEHPGGGSQAQTQAKDYREGETRGLPETPQGKADVPGQGFQAMTDAGLTGLLLVPVRSSERDRRLPPGFGRRHSGPDVLLGLHGQVERKLLIQLPLHGCLVHQCPDALPPTPHPDHAHILRVNGFPR
jgi:hypothetical protein